MIDKIQEFLKKKIYKMKKILDEEEREEEKGKLKNLVM